MMNELLAREILGCSSNASFKELKASYRRMIMLVHPDRVSQETMSQERAKEASSRLNYAWEYIENREKLGLLGQSDNEFVNETAAPQGRPTYPHECDICGYAPATKVSAPIVSTFIYFIRRGKYELNACKLCGMALSRMALRNSLLKGWWGLGIVFIPNVIYRYVINMNLLRKIDNPTFRDPSVRTLSEYPFKVPASPFRQPAPLIASAIALIAILAVILSDPSQQSATSSAAMYFGQTNSCYEQLNTSEGQKIQMVDCASFTAILKSIATVEAENLCPENTLYTAIARPPDGDAKIACLTTISARTNSQ